MKKLRPSAEEKSKLMTDIADRLARFNNGSIEDFKIDDLLNEHAALPENVEKPTLKISSDCYMKMLELINQSSVECSWHGLVRRFKEDNTYLIYDILVFPQINSATSTTTDEKEFAEWQTKLIMDPDFPIEDLRMHGHSHVNMNVFSSGIDDQYQEDLITKVDNGDYYIFLIMNKKMEICIFIYDFDQQIRFDKEDINFMITDTEGYDIRSWAKDELDKNACTARPVNTKTYKLDTYDDNEYSYFYGARPIFKGGNAHGFK